MPQQGLSDAEFLKGGGRIGLTDEEFFKSGGKALGSPIEDTAAIKAAQAAKYPSSQDQGKGGAGIENVHPSVNNAMTTLWGDLNSAFKPIQSIDNLKASVWDILKGRKSTADDPSSDLNWENTKKRLLADPVTQKVLKGDYSGAVGSIGAALVGAMIPGAAGDAASLAPALLESSAAGTLGEALSSNAAHLRQYAETPAAASGLPSTPLGLTHTIVKAAARPIAKLTASAEAALAKGLGPEIVSGSGIQNILVPPEQSSVAAVKPTQSPEPFMNHAGLIKNAEEAAAARAAEESAAENAWQNRGNVGGEPLQGEVPGNPRQFDATGRPAPTIDLNTSEPAPAVHSAPELNKWMNVKESQLLYGKNPAEQILSENLLGPDKASTLENVTSARKSVGAQMEEVFKSAEAKGIRFNLEEQIQNAIADAKKTIGKSTDEAFMKSIEGIESDIASRTGDLKSATPSEAHELEVELGRGVKWTSPGATDVSRVLKDMRGRISRVIKAGVPDVVPLKDRWGNLFEGEQALKSSIRKDAIGRGTGNATPPNLFQKMQSNFSQSSTGPGTIPELSKSHAEYLAEPGGLADEITNLIGEDGEKIPGYKAGDQISIGLRGIYENERGSPMLSASHNGWDYETTASGARTGNSTIGSKLPGISTVSLSPDWAYRGFTPEQAVKALKLVEQYGNTNKIAIVAGKHLKDAIHSDIGEAVLSDPKVIGYIRR